MATDNITKGEVMLISWKNVPILFDFFTVPDELSNHIEKFIIKNTEKAMHGNKTAVSREFFSQFVP